MEHLEQTEKQTILPQPSPKKKYLFVGITAAILVGAGIFTLLTQREAIPEVDKTAGWQIYRNEKFGFEVQYPYSHTPFRPESWETYKNDEFGFEFKYPSDHTPFNPDVFSNPDQKLVVADTDSKIVIIAADEELVFCCDFQRFQVEVTKKNTSLNNKVTELMERYYSDGDSPSEIREVNFRNREAIEIRGYELDDPPTAKFRVLVIDNGDIFITITYDNHELFPQILSTLRFQESPKAIENSKIKVVTPNGGEEWGAGSTNLINWEVSPDIQSVKIVLWGARDEQDFIDPVSTALKPHVLDDGVFAQRGYMIWAIDVEDLGIDLSLEKYFKITIEGYKSAPGVEPRKTEDLVEIDSSDKVFAIVQPSISITSPTSQTAWDVGSTHTISWNSVGVDEVRITTAYGGKNLGDSPLIDAQTGVYTSYQVPDGFDFGIPTLGPPYEFKIRVYSGKDSGLYDEVTYIAQSPIISQEEVMKRVGEQENSFWIQKINSDSVEGLFSAYPLPSPVPVGALRTLHIGDDIGLGYWCDGISEELTSIDFTGQTVTFSRVERQPPLMDCPTPICLAGNTLIDTPSGAILVTDLKIGMSVWTTDASGHRVTGVVQKTSRVPVPSTHKMVRLVLEDGREILVSPGHATVDGNTVGNLIINDFYDGSRIITADRVSYNDVATYDILPSGETGFYWANGILLDSTLH